MTTYSTCFPSSADLGHSCWEERGVQLQRKEPGGEQCVTPPEKASYQKRDCSFKGRLFFQALTVKGGLTRLIEAPRWDYFSSSPDTNRLVSLFSVLSFLPVFYLVIHASGSISTPVYDSGPKTSAGRSCVTPQGFVFFPPAPTQKAFCLFREVFPNTTLLFPF